MEFANMSAIPALFVLCLGLA